MGCYPSPGNFNIDVELRGQLRCEASGDDLFEATDIASNYVGIVARMPLYSYTELDRERGHEYHRRTKIYHTNRPLLTIRRNLSSEVLSLFSNASDSSILLGEWLGENRLEFDLLDASKSLDANNLYVIRH